MTGVMQETLVPAGSRGRLPVKTAGQPSNHQAPQLQLGSPAEVASMDAALDEVGVCKVSIYAGFISNLPCFCTLHQWSWQ